MHLELIVIFVYITEYTFWTYIEYSNELFRYKDNYLRKNSFFKYFFFVPE